MLVAAVLSLLAGLVAGCGPASAPSGAEEERPLASPTPVLTVSPVPPATAAPVSPSAGFSSAAEACVSCHQASTPGIVNDWRDGRHAGAGVDCVSCHAPGNAGSRPDAFSHHGLEVVTLVTPAQCGQCHPQESAEFLSSAHADAARVAGSLDSILGEIVAGGPAATSGCQQCHGSTVRVAAGQPGELDPATWPNNGIGRVNPDGSTGTCTACHSRHGFRIAQARQPEACGTCHLGPAHPQYEVWQGSRHGARYRQALNEGWEPGLDRPGGEWWPGREYYITGPTCASCHISATRDQAVTHDVGARISWTLRSVLSTHQEDWQRKRAAMQRVCFSCHSRQYVTNFYAQLDALVALYNDKFAASAQGLMDRLYADGRLTATPLDEEIEWVYYDLWHNAGRRARQGAAMASPDQAWWRGMYDLARSFYNEFLPRARVLDPAAVEAILARPEHAWVQGLSPEQIERMLQFYQGR